MAGKNTDARRIMIIERQQKALELRKSAIPYRTIAKELGISEAQAFKDVKRALDGMRKRTQEEVDDLIAIEKLRIEMAMKAIASQVRAGHLGSIDRWIKLSESIRKLEGLDTMKSQVEVTIKDDEINAAIEAEFERYNARLADLESPRPTRPTKQAEISKSNTEQT